MTAARAPGMILVASLVSSCDGPTNASEECRSTGELASQDSDGNLLSEIEIFGLGPEAFRAERDYRKTTTRRACVP